MGIFLKVVKILASFFFRAGLDGFLKKNIELANETITQLAIQQNGAPLHLWKQQAFELLKEQTNQLKDNWVQILLHLAYENFLGKR